MRILYALILLAIALFAPFWAFCIVSFLYILNIRSPYEVVGIGLLIDAMFGEPAQGIWYQYTMYTGIVFVLVSYIRPFFRFDT